MPGFEYSLEPAQIDQVRALLKTMPPRVTGPAPGVAVALVEVVAPFPSVRPATGRQASRGIPRPARRGGVST